MSDPGAGQDLPSSNADQPDRSWPANGLLDPTDHEMQAALWMAVRTLDEKAALASRTAASARQRGNLDLVRRFSESAAETGKAARLLRSRLTAGQSDTGDDEAGSGEVAR